MGVIENTVVFLKNWTAISLMAYTVLPVSSNEFEMFTPHANGADFVSNGIYTLHGDGYQLEKMNSSEFYFLSDVKGHREFDRLLSRRYKYIVNEGSSRSSKTYSLIDCYDFYARSYANKRMTIWRDTKKDCKDTVLNDFEKRMKSTGRYEADSKFKKTTSTFEYDNGAKVEICGTDDSEKVHGMTQDVAWINEPYKISQDTFDQIDQRTADFIFLDWNPKKSHWIETVKKDDKAFVIKSTFLDNPFCPQASKVKLLSYQPLSKSKVVLDNIMTLSEAFEYDTQANELELPRELLNEITRCRYNEQKGTASEYNWSVYGLGEKAERPHRIYKHFKKITKIEFDDVDAEIFYVVDWGAVDPWAILAMKYDDGVLYYHELNYDSEDILKVKLGQKYLQIREMSENNEGLVAYMFNKLKIPTNAIIICDNNRKNKILALRKAGWEYAVAAVKGKICDGIDLLNDMAVRYTSESDNFETEQEAYSREVDKYGIVQEEPEDENNHLMDCARYGAEYLRQKGIIKKA